MTTAQQLAPGTYEIAIERVEVGPRLRVHSDASDLRESMALHGLIHPITVTTSGRLVAGAHRLQCARDLGWSSIRAEVRDLDDLHAELVEIDENLCSHKLTIIESGQHLERRKEILRQLGLMAKTGDNQHSGGDTVSPPRTTVKALAHDADVSERTAQRHMATVRSIDRDALEMAKPTALAASQKELDALARLRDAREQRMTVDLIAQGQARTVRDAQYILHPETAPLPVDPATDALNREAAEHIGKIEAAIVLRLTEANPDTRTRPGRDDAPREALLAIPRVSMNFSNALRENDAPAFDGLRELLQDLCRAAWSDENLRQKWVNLP